MPEGAEVKVSFTPISNKVKQSPVVPPKVIKPKKPVLVELKKSNNSNSEMSSEDRLHWMVHNSGNVAKIPNAKKVINESIFDTAIYFKSTDGQDYRVVLSYKAYLINGQRQVNLNQIKIINRLGKNVEIDKEMKSILESIKTSTKEVEEIVVNGTVIKIPISLPPTELKQYTDFMNYFYYDSSKNIKNIRNIEQLSKLDSKEKMKIYKFWLKYYYKPLNFLKDRMFKIGIAVGAGTIGGFKLSEYFKGNLEETANLTVTDSNGQVHVIDLSLDENGNYQLDKSSEQLKELFNN